MRRIGTVAAAALLGLAGAVVVAAPAEASGTITVYNSSASDNRIMVYNDAIRVEKIIDPGHQTTISDVYDAARVNIDIDSGIDIGSYRYKSSPTGSYTRWRCGEPSAFNPYSTGLKYTGIQTSRYANDCS